MEVGKEVEKGGRENENDKDTDTRNENSQERVTPVGNSDD